MRASAHVQKRQVLSGFIGGNRLCHGLAGSKLLQREESKVQAERVVQRGTVKGDSCWPHYRIIFGFLG